MKGIRLCDDGALLDTIEKCNKYNVGIEVQQFHDLLAKQGEDEYQLEDRLNKDIESVKDSLNQITCGKSLHGPFREMNVGSKVPEIVNAAEKYYMKAYNIASSLGCTEIVFHNGYIPGTSGETKWAGRAINFRKKFLDSTKGITICLENQFELNSDMLIKIIDGVNDSRLKVCLDIGHAHANSNMSVETRIETLGDRIVYYHLHNNHGKQDIPEHNNDEHLGLKYGTIDIANVLKYAENFSPDAIWCLESGINYQLEDLEILKSLGYLS